MERNIERFRKRAILFHWVHMVTFSVLLVTGWLMFLPLTDFDGGHKVRVIHRISAVLLVAVPALYAIIEPRSAFNFVKESFQWAENDRAWLRSAWSYYFGRRREMPAQGRINGDQRLWQLTIIVTSAVFILTGAVLWFFKLRIPLAAYQWVLIAHAVAFLVVSVMFMAHVYLRMVHPSFNESLASMMDGKVSEQYAAKHYGKWEHKQPAE